MSTHSKAPILSVPYKEHWLHSDGVIKIDNCQQDGDSVVTVLPAVVNIDYIVQSLCSPCT